MGIEEDGGCSGEYSSSSRQGSLPNTSTCTTPTDPHITNTSTCSTPTKPHLTHEPHEIHDLEVLQAQRHDSKASLRKNSKAASHGVHRNVNATVEAARGRRHASPPIAAPQQPSITPPHMTLELPGLQEGAPQWTYTIEEHSYQRMTSSAPWPPMSREAALEKHLQLRPARELATHVATYLMDIELQGTSSARPHEKMWGSVVEGWQIATMVNRLITYESNWWAMISEAYLHQQNKFTLEQRREIEFQKSNPTEAVTRPTEPPSRLQQIESHVETAEREGKVTYFSRRVLVAWRQTTAERKAKLSALRLSALRDGPSTRAGKPKEAPAPSASLNDLPAFGELSPAAYEELNLIAAAVRGDQSNQDPDVERENEKLFDRVRAEARRLARQKGSSLVNYRDIRQSAESIDVSFRRKITLSPAEEQPEHIDEVVESLAALKAETLRLSRGGIAPPRVLVVGETGSAESPPIVAKMFQDAGADVATCDFKISTFEGVPHYHGDAVNVQDQGWDLVICHPPCTYLSNAGVTWLKDDPVRWKQMRQNASVFRMLYAAQAPFVAAENAKMHKHARLLIGDLRPTQYVHPWQHGHGHTKPTGLYLRNLPPLVPSKEVRGRENVLATLMPSPTRAEKRSRTYPGIAAAMTLQWMPTLHRHSQSPATPRNGLTAEQMVTRARLDTRHQVQLAFVRRAGGYIALTQNTSLLTKESPEESSPITTVLELAEEAQIPEPWMKELQRTIETYPDGSRCFYKAPDAQSRFRNIKPIVTRVWVVDVSDVDSSSPDNPQPDLQWTPVGLLKPPIDSEWPQDLVTRYRQEVEAVARAPLDLLRPQILAAINSSHHIGKSTNRRPWLIDYQDLPPPPPTPRHIRRLQGKWRVWNVVKPEAQGVTEKGPHVTDANRKATKAKESAADLAPTYSWQLLPPTITDRLNAHLGLPFKPMKATLEEASATFSNDIEEKPPTSKESSRKKAVALQPTECAPGRSYPRVEDPSPGAPVVASGSCAFVQTPNPLIRKCKMNVRALWDNGLVGQKPAEWIRARGGKECPPLTEKSKLLWDNRPSKKSEETPNMGLGASHGHLPDGRPPYPTSGRARLSFIRNEYQRFEYSGLLGDELGPSVRRTWRQWRESLEPKEGNVATVNPPVHPEDPTISGNQMASVTYSKWLAQCSDGREKAPTVATLTRSLSSDSIMEQDIARTPTLEDYSACSLYVTDFHVVRRAQTRQTADALYTVSSAVAGKVLADTGAAPSIVTTELLEKLPKDCRISRDPYAAVGPLNGADGKPLVTLGKVKIDFLLGGTPCQHEFTVVQGKPLVLLGNDFLVPRNAEILLNTDGKGNGSINLTSIMNKGRLLQHSFQVTGNTRHADHLRPVKPMETQDAAFVGLDQKDTRRPSKAPVDTSGPSIERWIPEPKKPEDLTAKDLTAEAFKDEGWTLETSEHLLYTAEAVEIPPLSRVTIRVRAPQQLIEQGGVPSCLVDRLRQVGPDGHPDTNEVPNVVPRLTTIQGGQLEVQLLNTTRRKKSVAGFSPLAMLDSEYYVRGNLAKLDPALETNTSEEQDPISSLSEQQTKLLDQVTIDPAGKLSAEKKRRVRRLVAENISAFATDPKNPTKTHLMEVELPLKPNATPHRHAASRVGEEGRLLIEKHIEEMESRGIIRKSNSAWGSRVVLVTKKDGSIRFCVDYRDLNSKLQLQDSPIPLTIEALDRLSSGKGCPSSLFLSTLDLASGFWTLPVKEADKGLTAFVTHRQKYEFNYLPFGIQSGPSYMVRLMDSALQGLAWETCMPYLDDVGVWSTGMGKDLEERENASFEQMMTRLRAVFERLRWAGMSMKASKCILFAIEAEYLGHIVSREGLKMDPKKIEVVRDWDTQDMSTVTKVRSFLGMCSYYRRFIEGFSRIAAPLTDLTKNGVDVEKESQTPECRRAMLLLIRAITSEPVMSTPRFDRPFIVKTDAANKEGLGGVLGQLDDEGREKVVAYHGRRLNKHERNYTVTEIELLAAVDSIKHWRPYLWGRAFKLVVDHSALRWLHTMRDTMEGGPASRLMRWILKLSEYRFHVEHKPGALHKDADAISRLVTREKPKEPLNDLMPTVAVAARGAKSKEQRTTTARSRQAAARTTLTTAEVQTSYLDTGAPSAAQLKQEQACDPECTEIMDYLSGSLDDISNDGDLRRLAKLVRVTTNGTHNQKKAVHASREHPDQEMKVIRRMEVRDGILYRSTHFSDENSQRGANVSSSPDTTQWVPFVPSKLRPALITAFHERMGHASRDRVQGALQKRFYWPNMNQEVQDHVSGCHECTMAKYQTTRSRDPVGPTVGQYPFDILYTDILDLAATHDYTPEGAGYRKLVVFADSLSRWVEAVPVHKDPTSAEFLDLFNEHIVARYGVPRAIVSDRGSNLVGKLNEEILKRTGVDLRGTASEHKQANGIVERFNQTIQNMIRASNEGGANWKDHLPFLLMAYRATPHRVTKESPAMILFGRELKTPAQIGLPDPSPSTLLHDGPTKEIREYATRLHNRMVYAWRAAYEASREAQGETVSQTKAHSLRGKVTYVVGDRVVRRLYDAANALANKYAGPYRITEVLGKGRYKVQDLENRLVYDEFDVSNLRPYRTHTDDEPLKSDEYIVERLLARRSQGGEYSYLVKYLGYPKSQAEWTSRYELERRCEEMLEEYDSKHPKPKKKAPLALQQPQPNEAELAPTPVEAADDPTSHLPSQARLSMGVWSYGREVKARGARSTKVVWKDSSHYTLEELESERFQLMRAQASEEAKGDHDVAAVFSLTTSHLRDHQMVCKQSVQTPPKDIPAHILELFAAAPLVRDAPPLMLKCKSAEECAERIAYLHLSLQRVSTKYRLLSDETSACNAEPRINELVQQMRHLACDGELQVLRAYNREVAKHKYTEKDLLDMKMQRNIIEASRHLRRRKNPSTGTTPVSVGPRYVRQPHSGEASSPQWSHYRKSQAAFRAAKQTSGKERVTPALPKEAPQEVAPARDWNAECYYSELTSGPLHELGPAPVLEEPADERAIQVWFVTNDDAMCYYLTSSGAERPQLNTYGGKMDASDEGSFADCALRQLSEEVVLPESWRTYFKRAVTLDPDGHALVKIGFRGSDAKTKTAVWFVRLTDHEALEAPTLTTRGEAEVAPNSMKWRPHGEILSNLSTFDKTQLPLITAMKKWLVPLSAR